MARTSAKKKPIDVGAQKIGQDSPRDLSTTGPAELDPPLIEVVDGPNWKDKAAALAFMEEPVKVVVHTSSDKNAEFIVEVWNNGKAQRFLRNVPIVVKRKYVEALARGKTVSYTQEHYKDDNGADAIRNIPSVSLRYPFSVIEDSNPNGNAWLQKILNEA